MNTAMTTMGPQAMAPIPANTGELATTAAAVRAQAEIQARYAIAVAKPRNFDGVRARLLKECKRFDFADAAIYKLPRGRDTVTGLSVRFAEAVRGCMTNMYCSRSTLLETEALIVMRVVVMDLETNTTEEGEVTVEKQLERRKLRINKVTKQHERHISERLNSYGDTVYLVPASRAEMRDRINAECARVERQCTLKLLDPGLKAEAEALCRRVLASGAQGDDGQARKNQLVDAFGELGVTPEELTGYLGHPLSQMTPDEFGELRSVYTGITKEGQTWASYVAGRDEEAESSEDEPEPAAKSSAVKDALKKRRAPAAKAEVAPKEPSEEEWEAAMKAAANEAATSGGEKEG